MGGKNCPGTEHPFIPSIPDHPAHPIVPGQAGRERICEREILVGVCAKGQNVFSSLAKAKNAMQGAKQKAKESKEKRRRRGGAKSSPSSPHIW